MKSVSLAISACLTVLVFAASASAETTSGQIAALGPGILQLSTGQAFNVLESTGVTLNGVKSSYANLEVGYAVSVEHTKCKTKTGYPCASSIAATTAAAPVPALSIYSITKSTVVLVDANGVQSSGFVDGATIITLNGGKAALLNLQPGMSCTVVRRAKDPNAFDRIDAVMPTK
jgi:hypothetical protein